MVRCDEAPPHTGSLGQRFCKEEKKKKCLFIFSLHSHADYKKLETLHSCPRGIWSVPPLLPPVVTFHHQFIDGTKEDMLVFLWDSDEDVHFAC